MSTYLELVNQVESNLQGFALDQDEMTFLSQPMTGTDLTFTVDEPRMISHGQIQIDDELLWVKKVDNQAGVVTVSPFGRGYKASTAKAHSAGAMIVDNPKFPRVRIRETLNTAIKEMYPELYVMKSYEFPYIAARSTYDLPANIKQIHSMFWQTIGPSKMWAPLTRYHYNATADTTAFPTGKTVDLMTPVIPGRLIKVNYLDKPAPLVNDSDEFSTTTGFDDAAQEAAMYGTCYRLAGWLEPPRLQTLAIETTMRSPLVPPKSATDVGQYFYNLYQQSLTHARDKMLKENPPSKHFRYI